MKTRIPYLAALMLLAATTSARAQKDAAELLPAHTLACLEVRQPARLSREAAALVKGSALEELPRRLARWRADGGMMDWRVRNQLSMLSVFCSPELIAEAGRIRGGFVALTGFAADGTPEIAALLQTGDSNLPSLVLRTYLIESRTRIVEEVEGVPLFRERIEFFRKGGPGGEVRETGPVFAQLPKMVLLGSSVNGLKEIIRRAKGKSADASLAGVRAFRDAAELRNRPGLFAYVDAEALTAQLDEQTKQPGHPLGREWAMLKTVLGRQTVRTLTASLTLYQGHLEGQVRVNLDAESSSPLLTLLPDKPAPRELLHFASPDTSAASVSGLGDGGKRWKAFVELLDALHQMRGGGQTQRPSRVIGEMQEKVNLNIEKDIFAPLTGMAFLGGSPTSPLLILRAADVASARALEEKGLPKLLGLASGELPAPAEEDLDGQHIRTVAGDNLPWRSPVSYGRRGAVLVLGLDRRRVAASLTAGGKKAGALAEAIGEKLDAAVVALTVVPLDRAMLSLSPLLGLGRPRAPVATPPPGIRRPLAPPPQARPPADDSMKELRQLSKAVEGIPPLVFTVSRQPDNLMLQLRRTSLPRALPRVLNAWIEAILGSAGQGNGIRGFPLPAPDAPQPRKPPAKRGP